MTRRLLVLGGSRQAVGGLMQLRDEGFELVVCDMDETAPGFDIAQHRVIGSVYHIEDCLPAIEAFHRNFPIDGVMCLACDVPHVVARIAEKLNLPGLPVEVADRAIDKLAMKEKFSLDGVAVPYFAEVENAEHLKEIRRAQACELVVKPVDSRGSKGVSRLGMKDDAKWAYDYAVENSPSGRAMAEAYLEGPQISSESVVINGKAITPALSDRSYEYLDRYYPFIVENGGDMPTSLPTTTVEKIRSLIDAAAASLGVKNGVVKGDIVVHGGEPYMIELAARLSGGYFCTHQIPMSTDVKLVCACARIALGETLDPKDWIAKCNKPVSTRWKLVEPGRVKAVPEKGIIAEKPGVRYFEHWLNIGDVIDAAQNAAASVAMVQAEGVSQKDAIANAEAALAAFNPEIVPTEPAR